MINNIFQHLILGIIQGIAEWLPISSSGLITLVMVNFFSITDLSFILHQALFLHLGTFFAALIYFRKDVADLLESLFCCQLCKSSNTETKKLLKFLIISTIITGVFGILILNLLMNFDLILTGKIITFSVSVLLLITGTLQLSIRNKGLRKITHLKNSDSILAGFAQGLSAMPGLSRSGITISTLLLRKFDDTTALKLSFLMSLPVVFIGNILLNINQIIFISMASFVGLTASFVFGLLTIHTLIKISRKINFAWFAIIIALLMMISVLV